jgi:hypothetical protein
VDNLLSLAWWLFELLLGAWAKREEKKVGG